MFFRNYIMHPMGAFVNGDMFDFVIQKNNNERDAGRVKINIETLRIK